ncbi:MAG: hypothetical protein HPY53_03210 [Brevinematales bacterium]|nr:hypothetical protein [Brevinematales bacterium]
MKTAFVLKGELSDHDTIKLKEPVPIEDGEINVIIEKTSIIDVKNAGKSLYGALRGEIKMADDFNAPLECFK